MSLTIRMRRALAAFREPLKSRAVSVATEAPPPPASDEPLTWAPTLEPGQKMTAPEIRQSVVKSQVAIVGGRSPRDVAKYLLTIAGWRTCSPPVKAAIRVEALILMQWMDRMCGREGDGPIDLSVPKPKVCPTCNGKREGIEGYDAGGHHGERTVTCPDCNGEGTVDGH